MESQIGYKPHDLVNNKIELIAGFKRTQPRNENLKPLEAGL